MARRQFRRGGSVTQSHLPARATRERWPTCWYRSEEHTSELQSRVDLVCRLLLEKKKKNRNKKGQRSTEARDSPINKHKKTIHHPRNYPDNGNKDHRQDPPSRLATTYTTPLSTST